MGTIRKGKRKKRKTAAGKTRRTPEDPFSDPQKVIAFLDALDGLNPENYLRAGLPSEEDLEKLLRIR